MPDVTIKVKTLDSNTHSFTVSDSLSVQEFKASIESTVGVDGGQQRLIYCGKVLVDDKHLSEYDLNGKTIHLVVRAPPSNTPSSSSNSASANADDATSGSASGRRSAPPFGSARVENGQLVGAWYLPSTLDPANIQSMVQGVISNLGDLGRNATVLSNEDGSAVDVHINLSHLAGPPASSPTTASGQGRSEQQQNLHGRFQAHANNFEVQQRVAQIRHLLQNIQLDLGELQRLSQEPTASSSRASNNPSANEPPSSEQSSEFRSGETPMDTSSTPTADPQEPNSNRTTTTSNTTTTAARTDGQLTNEPPPTLDAAAIAASAAASAAETAAQLARQAAAAVAATMYGSPHVTQVRTNIPAIFVHTRVGANGPGGSESSTRASATSTSANTQTGPGDFTQTRTSTTRSAPQSSALPNVSEFTAREFADLLQSVREVESTYHQHLRNFEECLRKPDNESSGSPNTQIHRGVSSIMHQFGTIYYMLSELSVNFDRPAPRTVSLYPSIATVNATPVVSTRQPRSSSLPRGGSIRVSTSTSPGTSTTNASTSAQRQPGVSQSSARIFPLVVTPLHASVEIIPSVAPGVNVSARTTSSATPVQSRPAAPVPRAAAIPSSSSSSSSNSPSQPISSRLTALESAMRPASISTANWQSTVPPAWVPVIASDLARQQSEPSAARTAFSEAYLNGLPKKKRRTDDGSSGH